MEHFNKNGLLMFIDMSIKQGLINPNTGSGWKAAVKKILEAVGTEDDIRQLDVKSEVLRYANRHPGTLAPDSLNQYEKRITQAISYFVSYKNDPTKFKPIGRPPGAAPKAPRKEKVVTGSAAPMADVSDLPSPPPPSKSVTGIATDTSLAMPFPLRAGFLAQIVIPRDLTKDEAARLCAFIQTLALPPAASVPSVATEEAE